MIDEPVPALRRAEARRSTAAETEPSSSGCGPAGESSEVLPRAPSPSGEERQRVKPDPTGAEGAEATRALGSLPGPASWTANQRRLGN